jgi:hypothetical protein
VGPVDVRLPLRLEVADGVVRRGVHDALDAPVDGRVVGDLRPVDVVRQDGVPRRRRPRVAREVYDRADALAGLPHRLRVRDIADEVRVVRLRLGRTVEQQSPVVVVGETLEDGPADAPAGPGQQHGVVHVRRFAGRAKKRPVLDATRRATLLLSPGNQRP